MKRFCLAVDLVDDADLIAAYEQWHSKETIWTEVKKSIEDSGITKMEIYRTGNRLFMIIQASAAFSFEQKCEMDAANQKVQEWEGLMATFQQSLPWAKEGEKWVVMDQIFEFETRVNGFI